MANLSVVIKSSDVRQDLLQAYHPDNWSAFENAVEQHLRQVLAAMGITSVQVDIALSNHPGPLLLRFTVDSTLAITADQLKAVLKR
jgi:hypothetical protein